MNHRAAFRLLALLCLVAPLGALQAQVAVVVRHAEKASETERDPMLSAIGAARAWALDSALAGVKISAVVVTPFQRTAQTAAQVSRRHGLTPIEIPVAGGIPAHAEAVAAEVRRHSGVVLVVGHSNTVGAIVAALGGTSDIGELPDSLYSAMFIVLPGGTARVSFGVP